MFVPVSIDVTELGSEHRLAGDIGQHPL
jgi:hypothetical protein